MYMNRILVVEDNAQLRKYVHSTLERAGYLVTTAGSGEAAFSRLRYENFDLVLLDLMLGDTHGLEILRLIRRQNDSLPVIIVSTCMDVEVKVDGFEIGCDDYLTKPFYSEELLSRVKRLLKRRSAIAQAVTTSPIADTINCPPFELDIRRCQVKKHDTPIGMRRKLFDILLYLVQRQGETVSKRELLNHCWDHSDEATTNSLYVHIRQLRSLIEDSPNSPRYVNTVRGFGFRFTPYSAPVARKTP